MEVKTDNRTKAIREKICDKCEHKEYVVPIVNLLPQCNICRCFLKSKIAWKYSSCPVGKW